MISHGGKIFVPVDEVHRLRDEIIGRSCSGVCSGTGSLLRGGVFEDCTCLELFRKRYRYTCAGIPRKYWDFTFDDLTARFEKDNEVALQILRTYCEKIDEMLTEGVGLYIQGRSGLAKSAIATFILKAALDKGYESYATRMSLLTKAIFESLENNDKREFLRWIQNSVQILLVDEIDKEYKVSDTTGFAGSRVNEFFGNVYNTRKALIVTSNLSKTDLRRVHAENVVDRLEELPDIILVGESYRKPNTALSRIIGGLE